MGAQFTIPLIEVIPGQLIASALWNNEWNNLNTNFIPAGMDSYSDTDSQMQIQTNPYPGSVTSHATSLGGEIERIRYQISQIIGQTYWYQAPAVPLNTVANVVVPIGGSIRWPSATPPSANWLIRNGQPIGRVAYAALFALIGTTYGAGDGVTTFNIPNDTDKMPIGAGNLYSLAATGGAVANTPSISITDPGHNHTQNAHTHTDSGHVHTGPSHTHSTPHSGWASGGSGAGILVIGSGSGALQAGADNTDGASGTGNTGTGTANNQNTTATNNSNTTGITAGSSSVPTLPPYLAEYWMIRVL
jgi:microcystin-dependent protein